jgi:hypothetical protein
LHKLLHQIVTLHPGNSAKKSGKCVYLRIAERAGLPVSHVHKVKTTSDGKTHIYMNYIKGQPLSEVRKELSVDRKKEIA